MIGTKVQTKLDRRKVLKKAQQAHIKNLGHAGAALRLTARRSIRTRKKPSPPGTPPHSRRGQLKRSIAYALEPRNQRVVIGPDADVVGTSGKAHEFGGSYRSEKYPKRPFMGPALQKLRDRLTAFWANSVR